MARKKRMFRGIPVREARASIHVQPNKADINGATKEDPTNCAYARCLKRTLEAPNVYVFKVVAYIQTLDEFGRPIMERYKVKKHAHGYLLRFDHGEKVEPGGFVFHKPSRCSTLTYKQKQQRERFKQGKKSPRVSEGHKPRSRTFSLRQGTGLVHFFGKEDQISTRTAKS